MSGVLQYPVLGDTVAFWTAVSAAVAAAANSGATIFVVMQYASDRRGRARAEQSLKWGLLIRLEDYCQEIMHQCDDWPSVPIAGRNWSNDLFVVIYADAKLEPAFRELNAASALFNDQLQSGSNTDIAAVRTAAVELLQRVREERKVSPEQRKRNKEQNKIVQNIIKRLRR
jgi:hypothetical protein